MPASEYCYQCMTPEGARGCPHKVEPRDRSRVVSCDNEHIGIVWTHPGVCPLCASHEEMDRLRTAAEKLHAFVNAKGQEHEENALGRTNTQSKTYDEERALVCWQVLDEIEALFQGAQERPNDGRSGRCGIRISGDKWCTLDHGHEGNHV